MIDDSQGHLSENNNGIDGISGMGFISYFVYISIRGGDRRVLYYRQNSDQTCYKRILLRLSANRFIDNPRAEIANFLSFGGSTLAHIYRQMHGKFHRDAYIIIRSILLAHTSSHRGSVIMAPLKRQIPIVCYVVIIKCINHLSPSHIFSPQMRETHGGSFARREDCPQISDTHIPVPSRLSVSRARPPCSRIIG